MADVKISQLPASTTPLDGTEVLPIVQSATTKQVSVANLTAGRAVSALSLSLTNALPVTSGGTGIASADQGALLSATGANTFSATRTPTLGLAGTAAGTLGLSGSTSGVVTLATAAAAGTWTFTLPTSGGTNGYILTTNGSGVSSWTNPTALGIDLDVGTTAITGATDKYVLYNNNGTLGNYAVTGTGTTVVLSTSPTFTTGFTSPLHIGGTTASSSLTLQSTSGVGTSDSILFKVGNNGATTALTIDTAGNAGLGVTPSAWGGSFKALELTAGSLSSTSTNIGISSNAYRGASSWTYSTSAAAALYQASGGAHIWYTAASGSAGSAISFTQAMTLDASGNLGVGTSSPVSKLDVYTASGGIYQTVRSAGSTSGDYAYYKAAAGSFGVFNIIYGSGAAYTYSDTTNLYIVGTSAAAPLLLQTNNAERARIDSSGNLLVGTTSALGAGPQITVVGSSTNRSYLNLARETAATSGVCGSLQGYNGTNVVASIDMQSNGANNSGYIGTYTWSAGSPVQGPYVNTGGTSWTTPSDENLKNILAPITCALDKVLALNAIYYALKADSTQVRRVGFTAQNMQAVLPEVVSAKADGELGVDYSATTPLLTAAIQELAAKVSALEAKQ